MTARNDRRTAPRTVVTLPVRLKKETKDSELTAETRDISTNGVFLYSDQPIEEGANLELVLLLPPELTAGEKGWVCCQVRVLRVEKTPGQKFGAAAEIRRMHFLPEIPPRFPQKS
jgi:PilZ domain